MSNTHASSVQTRARNSRGSWRIAVAVALLAFALSAIPAVAFQDSAATPSAGGVTVEFLPDFGTAASSQTVDAEGQAQQYLLSKGWSEGTEKSKGWIIAVGGMSLMCGSDDPRFDECRQRAYSEAMLEAKSEIAEALALEVRGEIESHYAEDDIIKQIAASRLQALEAQPDLVGRISVLANAVVDRELREQGIDVGNADSFTAEQRTKALELARRDAEQLTSSAEFREAIETAARAETAAVQAFRTFEFIAPGQKGSIAVVAIYSPKSRQLQRALLGLGAMPSGANGQQIASWAAAQGEDLLYTFGVQPRVDERGELVLVAFGQAVPVGNSERQLDAAAKKADVRAQGAARYFLGELVENTENLVDAGTLKEYADGSDLYESASGYEATCRLRAESLKMPGAHSVYQWKQKHPLSDKVTCGSVYVVSVSSALAANQLRELFERDAASRGGAGISNARPTNSPWVPSGQPAAPSSPGNGGNSGQGVPGEEP